MASQYDSIKTAEELLKEVAAHGLSTKPEDICRAQDIFGRSEVKELIRLCQDNGRLKGFDGEPDPRGTYSSGRVGLSKYFYQVAFKIWSWEDATRFYNQHSNFPVIDALEENKMLHQQVKELNGELKRPRMTAMWNTEDAGRLLTLSRPLRRKSAISKLRFTTVT